MKVYRDDCEAFLIKNFAPSGYNITKKVSIDPIPESAKYDALTFALNNKNIVYRKGKVTPDRPGAFLALWQRPSPQQINENKPIPLDPSQLDYLFMWVDNPCCVKNNEDSITHPQCGIFIFPVALLIKKGIVSSAAHKGKTGFRVFPPWSQDRGLLATKRFSESGKKTQRWQLPYFLKIDNSGLINTCELNRLLNSVEN
jgi:hypothetical protein